MAQIEVRELGKTFQVAERRAGLSGALVGLIRRKTRTIPALQGVSFKIDAGEMVAYIGPNGAGKSTTIKILAGILVPSSGDCIVNGLVPWRSRTKHVAQIGVVFGQRTQLWWDLPVIESFDLLRDIYRVNERDYRHSMDEFIELLSLESLLDTPVRQLSLGQRMRCDLAAAMLHRPSILFLDEPTIGLDAVSKLRVRDFIARLNADTGVTVLLTTHNLDDVEALCRRVMIVNFGTVLSDGTLADLRSRFGTKRQVIVDFEDEPKLESSELALLESATENRMTFLVSEDVPDVVSALTAKYRVRDLFVQHLPIERIVAEIYGDAGA